MEEAADALEVGGHVGGIEKDAASGDGGEEVATIWQLGAEGRGRAPPCNSGVARLAVAVGHGVSAAAAGGSRGEDETRRSQISGWTFTRLWQVPSPNLLAWACCPAWAHNAMYLARPARHRAHVRAKMVCFVPCQWATGCMLIFILGKG